MGEPESGNKEPRRQSPILKFFAYDHLPADLQTVSARVGRLAQDMEELLPDGPEKSAGLRKLLEAKDCFVRSFIENRG